MPFPVDMRFIEELETDLGLSFPEKFTTKMTIENGGEFQTLPFGICRMIGAAAGAECVLK